MPYRHAGRAAVLSERRHSSVRAAQPRRPEVATPDAAAQAIHLVVNPAAGGGRARARARAAHEALRRVGSVRVVESRCRGDEARLAREAHADSARALVVLGGDGALSHAARGLVEERSNVPLTTLAAGTANDCARNLRWPAHDYRAMATLIERGRTRRIDAGAVDAVPFLNAAGFGFDAEVVSRLAARGKHAGRSSYAIAALSALRTYRGFDTRITASGVTTPMHLLMLVFANGAHFGGGFRIAPDARANDGLLDMIAIGDTSTARRVALFARATRGAHVDCAEVHTAHTREAELCFDAPVAFEADGELHHTGEAAVRVSCLPLALSVISAE